MQARVQRPQSTDAGAWSCPVVGECCTHRRKKQTFGAFQDVYRDVTLMANSFNLRRGGLSMCPGDTCSEELQMRAAPSAHRLALLYAREASKQVTKAGVAVSNWLLFLGTLRVGYQDRGDVHKNKMFS